MTQQDYEQKRRECWEEYIELGGLDDDPSLFNRVFRRVFALGMQVTKQEKSADTVIQGWVCRDNNSPNAHVLIGDKPKRNGVNFWENKSADYITLPTELFPDLTWESEPQKVEIIIKRKKIGRASCRERVSLAV